MQNKNNIKNDSNQYGEQSTHLFMSEKQSPVSYILSFLFIYYFEINMKC